jgi:cation diffusion facilitator CzcD-associated flavoprotein CzcO
MKFRGRGGKDLHEQWAEGARAYLGITVEDFPNLFLMYGPNTNLGAGSIIFMLECQARYLRQAVHHYVETGHPIAVRKDVADTFDASIQARLVDGVWSKCSSWYRNANGRISNNWPGTVAEYERRTDVFVATDYERG